LVLTLVPIATAQNVPVTGADPGAIETKPGAGTVVIPASSQSKASDAGVRAHTDFEVFVPDTLQPDEAPPLSGYAYETPASLACVYRLVPVTFGCNPNTVTANPTGGSKRIAIVDAYDDPEAASDLAYFSGQFGLPLSASQFSVVYASGQEPKEDPTGEWELEESLDIEYAHAMAPKAQIVLVEAASNSLSDLLQGVIAATNEVSCGLPVCTAVGNGAGEVSMSWGTGEFSSETSFDSDFTGRNVVYVASTGDSPGTSWPSTSPNVVAAGGSTTARSLVNGNFLREITWNSAGGGISLYEARPSYQRPVNDLQGLYRGVPDLSFDSNPYTGVWVWDSNYFQDLGSSGWFIVGGTSVAAQALTGIINAAGSFFPSTAAELTNIYNNRWNSNYFRQIPYGTCGPYSGIFATTGWDLCTGVGSAISTGGE
jgi:kumamolisin